jgi:hypothetical protein
MAGRRPLEGPICQDDINLVAGGWSGLENHTQFAHILYSAQDGSIEIMDGTNCSNPPTKTPVSATKFV